MLHRSSRGRKGRMFITHQTYLKHDWQPSKFHETSHTKIMDSILLRIWGPKSQLIFFPLTSQALDIQAFHPMQRFFSCQAVCLYWRLPVLPPVHSGYIILFILMKGTLTKPSLRTKFTVAVFRQDPIYVYVYMSLHNILYNRITYIYIYTKKSSISTHFRRFVSPLPSGRCFLDRRRRAWLVWNHHLLGAEPGKTGKPQKIGPWRNIGTKNERLQLLNGKSSILMSYISLKDVTSPSTREAVLHDLK